MSAALNPTTLAEQLRAMCRRAVLVYRTSPSGPVYGIHGTVPDLGTLTDAADQLERQETDLTDLARDRADLMARVIKLTTATRLTPLQQLVRDTAADTRRVFGDDVTALPHVGDVIEHFSAALLARIGLLKLTITDGQIAALMPAPDGVAEANRQRVEVLPDIMGTEFDEVDAWSLPLVRQVVRRALAVATLEGGAS